MKWTHEKKRERSLLDAPRARRFWYQASKPSASSWALSPSTTSNTSNPRSNAEDLPTTGLPTKAAVSIPLSWSTEARHGTLAGRLLASAIMLLLVIIEIIDVSVQHD